MRTIPEIEHRIDLLRQIIKNHDRCYSLVTNGSGIDVIENCNNSLRTEINYLQRIGWALKKEKED